MDISMVRTMCNGLLSEIDSRLTYIVISISYLTLHFNSDFNASESKNADKVRNVQRKFNLLSQIYSPVESHLL